MLNRKWISIVIVLPVVYAWIYVCFDNSFMLLAVIREDTNSGNNGGNVVDEVRKLPGTSTRMISLIRKNYQKC